jgi:hypothetical protein
MLAHPVFLHIYVRISCSSSRGPGAEQAPIGGRIAAIAQQQQGNNPNQVVATDQVADIVDKAAIIVAGKYEEQQDNDPPIFTGAGSETAHTKSLLVF